MWSFRYSNQVKGQNPTKILTKKHLVYRVNHFYLFLVYLVNQRNNSSNHNYLITKLLSHCIKLGASTGGTTNRPLLYGGVFAFSIGGLIYLGKMDFGFISVTFSSPKQQHANCCLHTGAR